MKEKFLIENKDGQIKDVELAKRMADTENPYRKSKFGFRPSPKQIIEGEFAAEELADAAQQKIYEEHKDEILTDFVREEVNKYRKMGIFPEEVLAKLEEVYLKIELLQDTKSVFPKYGNVHISEELGSTLLELLGRGWEIKSPNMGEESKKKENAKNEFNDSLTQGIVKIVREIDKDFWIPAITGGIQNFIKFSLDNNLQEKFKKNDKLPKSEFCEYIVKICQEIQKDFWVPQSTGQIGEFVKFCDKNNLWDKFGKLF